MSEVLKTNTTLTKLYLCCEKQKKERHTKDIHLQITFFSSTDNDIGERGAASLSESLKSNTTLTALNISGEDKRQKTLKRLPSTIHFFLFLFTSTGNTIGNTGATTLSEALKSNTTLTKLSLGSEDKRKKTHKRHPQISFIIIRQLDRLRRSRVIERSVRIEIIPC